MAEVIDVDPSGDVILVAGCDDDTKRIRVSISLLSAASPVFKSMFSKGRFAEGSSLHEHNFEDVSLPEDSSTAMLAYLRMCHHQADKVGKLSTLELRDFAFAVDKYQSMAQFGRFISLWAEEKTGGYNVCSDIAVCLDIACITKDVKLFESLCKMYIDAITPDMMPPQVWQACPADLHCYLANEAFRAKASIIKHVEKSIETILLGPARHRNECRRFPYVQSAYLKYLTECGVWPTWRLNAMAVRMATYTIETAKPTFKCWVDGDDFCVRKGCQDASNKIECPLGPGAGLGSVVSNCRIPCVQCVAAGTIREDGFCSDASHAELTLLP